jgi:hypothetical protein
MENWERKLTMRDRHRRIFPFSWGLDWLGGENLQGEDPQVWLEDWSKGVVRNSEEFFAPPEMEDCSLEDDRLTFRTPTPFRYKENGRVSCQLFPAPEAKSAVVVIPQWNASKESHLGLCRIIQRLGMTAVRITLPYHEERCPIETGRADYMVSPNLGRTIHAVRQAVLEVRQLVGWLSGRGYQKIGLVGTSIGSCVGYLAFTHDNLLDTAVFNHVSSHFADVVWTGLSTRYVKWGLEGHVKLKALRACWAPLSPWHFVSRLRENNRPHLLITAKYDLTFLPELGELLIERYREEEFPVSLRELPCGHYTTAHFPFKYLDGWHICRHLRAHLT